MNKFDWKEQYKKLVVALENDEYIFDDFGNLWYFDGEKIRLALADIDEKTSDSDRKENGYWCNSFCDGLAELKDGGYLIERSDQLA